MNDFMGAREKNNNNAHTYVRATERAIRACASYFGIEIESQGFCEINQCSTVWTYYFQHGILVAPYCRRYTTVREAQSNKIGHKMCFESYTFEMKAMQREKKKKKQHSNGNNRKCQPV